MGFAALYPSYTLGFAAAATALSVMAGLDPRVSGTVCAFMPLSRLRRKRDWRGGGERALKHVFVSFVREAQQQKGNQRDRDLDPNGVLGRPHEVVDFQGLLDPPEEQFDSPSSLVQIGDLLRARSQVIGEDAQHLAGLDHNPNLTDQTRHRILARSREPFRKMSRPIAQDRRSRYDRSILDDRKRRIGLEPRNDAAAGGMQLGPPAVIGIAKF